MKKEDLKDKIKQIESERGKGSCTYSTETMVNEQVKLYKLFIEMLNDFNEATAKYNIWLVRLTWAIAILTLVMVVNMLMCKV